MLVLLVSQASWAAERARLVLAAHRCGQRAFQVIAGNRHDVYGLAAAAKAEGLDPREVLRSSVLARAFTAHQLASLLEDTLPVAMAEPLAFAAVVDPLDLYADEEELSREEGIALLQRGLAKLRLLARRRPEVPLFVVQRPGSGAPPHWDCLQAVVDASVLLDAAPLRRRRAPALPLTAWLPPEPAPLAPPAPVAPEVMTHGPHHAHVPQRA